MQQKSHITLLIALAGDEVMDIKILKDKSGELWMVKALDTCVIRVGWLSCCSE